MRRSVRPSTHIKICRIPDGRLFQNRTRLGTCAVILCRRRRVATPVVMMLESLSFSDADRIYAAVLLGINIRIQMRIV